MKICYIAPLAATTADQGIIEKAISNAIQNTLVIPLQNWLLNKWIGFVSISYWLCLAIATCGVICAICGIPKGKKWAIGSIIFYILIRMVSYFNGWK